MNYWKEPYPININDLIVKSEKCLTLILEKLNHSECKTLSELYKKSNLNGDIQRQKKVFDELGYIPTNKLSYKDKKNNEIKGLYIFGEVVSDKVIPKYIGISGTIFRRFRQHGWGKLHNEATLAYLMAKNEAKHTDERKLLPYTKIEKKQHIIRNYKVAILPEMINYDLHFMEVYFSGKLKTEWNTYKTH